MRRILTSLALCLPIAAGAAESPAKATIELLTRGLSNVKTFEGPAGMTGVVGMAPAKAAGGKAQPVTFFVDQTGTAVIYGIAFNTKTQRMIGAETIVSVAQSIGELPAPGRPAAQSVAPQELAALKNASAIETGPAQGSTIIYAFIEPNCIYCQRAWREITAAQKASRLPNTVVRWIPIGFEQSGVGRASAGMATAGDGFAKLDRLFDGTPAAPNDFTQKVMANSALYESLGLQGTPTFFVVKGNASKKVQGWLDLASLSL